MLRKIVNLVLIIGMGLTGLVGATTVEASTPVKVGILQPVEHPSYDETVVGIKEQFETSGYVEGEDVEFEYLNASGDSSALPSMAERLANSSDYIIAVGTPSIQSLANETTEVPLYFVAVTDPVGAGVVETLEATGRNVTGTSNLNPMRGHIEMMESLVGNDGKLGLIYNSGEQNSQYQVEKISDYAQEAGFEMEVQGITSTNDIPSALDSILSKVDGLLVVTDNTTATAMQLVGDKAKEAGVPLIGGSNDMIEENGLATYGADYKSLGAQTARMVIRQMEEGLDPEQQPVEYAEDMIMTINEEYAKAIGVNPEDIKEPELLEFD